MSLITTDDDRLRALFKQALLELLEEKSQVLYDTLAEVVEEMGLVHAIKEGQTTPTIKGAVDSSLSNLVRTLYPSLWSSLNTKAQRAIPKGLREYLFPGDTEIGFSLLAVAEEKLTSLFKRIGQKEVADCYRRDLSSVKNTKQLSELLCEISLVAELSKLSSEPPQPRPKNANGRECDVKVRIAGVDVYVECKRFEDPGPCGCRSIVKSVGAKPANSDRPRSMDIYSKLHSDAKVYHQFPQGTVNIIFLFHRSFGQSTNYIRQALFGDRAFSEEGINIQLDSDGLFAREEWRNVSGCIYGEISADGKLIICALWRNPRALTELPESVWTVIGQQHR